jgi:hypothetical protein
MLTTAIFDFKVNVGKKFFNYFLNPHFEKKSQRPDFCPQRFDRSFVRPRH